jgi:hypothetical protein
MCDSMTLVAPSAKLNEIDNIMNDKIDLYSKIINYVKKNNVTLCAIILEIDNCRNFDFKNYSFMGMYLNFVKKNTLPRHGITEKFQILIFLKTQK